MSIERSRILVWDLPVRLFHWLLVISFIGAFLTAESEDWRPVHTVLGYTVFGLLLFRLVWAFVGTRYARFSAFAFGPHAVVAYLKSLVARTPESYVGHNPAGSWMIYAIVLLGLAVSVSGYALDARIGRDSMESLHEAVSYIMLGVVVVHVAGVLVASLAHRENLVRAMITGYKFGKQSDGIARPRALVGAALVCAVALLWTGIVNVSSLVGAPTGQAAGATDSKNEGGDADD